MMHYKRAILSSLLAVKKRLGREKVGHPLSKRTALRFEVVLVDSEGTNFDDSLRSEWCYHRSEYPYVGFALGG